MSFNLEQFIFESINHVSIKLLKCNKLLLALCVYLLNPFSQQTAYLNASIYTLILLINAIKPLPSIRVRSCKEKSRLVCKYNKKRGNKIDLGMQQ